jgi:hypothetical protein
MQYSRVLRYWVHFTAAGRRWCIGPFPSRVQALRAALAYTPVPEAGSLYTGCGDKSGCIDLIWHDRELSHHLQGRTAS